MRRVRCLLLALALTGCTNPAGEAKAQAALVAPTPAVAPGPASPRAAVDPFPGREQVTVRELLDALAAQVDAIGASPEVRRDYEAFLRERKLADDDELYRDYVRIRIAFEATRAGGLWNVQWQITDQLPQSDRVWAAWRSLALADGAALPEVTAIAECDELSALFAYVAHGLGLSRRSEVGLFWPASNHTVAVWTLDRTSAHPTRIVVPTSQVFLGPYESLGTAGFDPWAQRNIF